MVRVEHAFGGIWRTRVAACQPFSSVAEKSEDDDCRAVCETQLPDEEKDQNAQKEAGYGVSLPHIHCDSSLLENRVCACVCHGENMHVFMCTVWAPLCGYGGRTSFDWSGENSVRSIDAAFF